MKLGLTRIFLLSLVFLGRGAVARGEELTSTGTVPLIFDDNRVFAELAFVRPDGTLRKALAFVDLGTPVMVVDEKLREELEIDKKKFLSFRAGDLEVRVDPSAVESDSGLGATGSDGKRTVPVEAVLSASVLKKYQVVFDYGKRTLTIATPNTLKGNGAAVPCRVNAKTGLISVTAAIAEDTYTLAVDTGSAYSWIRADVAEQWVKAHPDWKRGTGAVGEANMQTRTDGAEARATILRLPEIRLSSLGLKQIGVLGIAPGAPPFPPAPGENKVPGSFFDWYSRKAPESVIGWIGGNVLRGFRLTIDFPQHMTYWESEDELDPHDLDQVGVTLEKRANGYFIAGIAEKGGKPSVDAVRAGDKLIQIDNVIVTEATRGAVFAALHGKPGAIRMLVLERDGKRIRVPAKVSPF
jgi:hypothetical protein